MLSFMEFLAQNHKMALPDTRMMLAMASVPLGFPDEEKNERLLNRDRIQRPAGGKANKTMVPMDSKPARTARKRF